MNQLNATTRRLALLAAAVVAFLVLGGVAQAAVPTVVLPSPPNAVAGATGVVITGTSFLSGSPLTQNTVKFNGITATVTAATTTSITVTVPSTATSGKVTVTNANGTGTSAADFFVIPSGFTAGTVDQMTRLTLGTNTSVTLATGHLAIQIFDTTSANQRVFIKWTGSTIPQMTVTLKGPTGTYLVATAAGMGTNWIDTITLATAGTYTLTTSADVGTGSLTMNVSSPAADVAVATTPTSGGAASVVTTTDAGQNGKVTFTGVNGRRLFVSFAGSTIPTGSATLLDPNGLTLASAPISLNASYIDAVTLPSGGTFTILIDPAGSNVGTVTATLYDLPATDPAAIPISPLPGSAVVTTTIPGINQTLTFTGTVGHKLSVKMTGSTFSSVTLSLLKPDATLLTPAIGARAVNGFIDAVTVPATGTYTLKVDPQGAAIGSATFTVYDITSDATYAVTLTTPAPTTVSGTVVTTIPGQNGIVTFSASSGQKIGVAVTGTSITGGKITLLDPSAVAKGSVGIGPSSFLDAITLTATGTYTVKFDPSDIGIGSVSYTIYNVPADLGSPTPIAITPSASAGGGTANATITTPGQNAIFGFTLGSPGKLAVKISGTLIKSGTVKVLDNGGTQIGAAIAFGTSGGWGEGYSLAAGTYTLYADPSTGSLGNVILATFLVPADPTGATTPTGALATLTTTVPGQNMRFTFTGQSGHGALVKMPASTITGGSIYLYDPSNVQIGSASISTVGAVIDTKTLAVNGTYTVVVDSKTWAIGSASVAVYDVPGDITGTLTNATPLTTATVAAGQNIVLSLPSITAGQRLAALVSAPAFSGSLKIINPDATILVSKTFAATGIFADATTTAQSGTYTFKLDPTGVALGAVTLTVWIVPANVSGPLLVKDGAAGTVTTTTPGQNATMTFTGNAQDIVKLVISGVTMGTSTCCGARITIQTPTATQLILAKSVGTPGGTIGVQLPATGTYTITIDPQSNAVGALSVALKTGP